MAKFPKTARKNSPGLENLEKRELLTGHGLHLAKGNIPITPADFVRIVRYYTTGIPASDRRIVQKLGDGSTVAVTLYGNGTLKDSSGQVTTIDPTTGSVNLVFNGTDNQTRIIANVWNADGRPSNKMLPLTGIRDANSRVGSQTGTGVDPVWAIVMPNFNLVNGSYVNLMGGIITVQLQQIEANTVMYLKEGVAPATTTQTVSTITSGGASVGGVTNVTAVNTTVTRDTVPPGVDFQVQRVVAGPLGTPALGDPALFTVDTTTGQLIRLRVNTVTGNGKTGIIDPTFTPITLPALGTTRPSLGLAANGTERVVLVGIGSTVYAYDAQTGAAAGQFTVPQLTSVDGIGSNGTGTLFTQTGGNGLSVDVKASLASGTAVGLLVVPQREFVFNGGVTGVAGSSVLYVDGAAHFDTAQPNLFQFGAAGYSLSGAESSRTAIAGPLSPYINAGANGLNTSPFTGSGSLDTRLARLLPAGALGSTDTIELFTPSTEAVAGTITLQTSDALYGLSESYHPELAGTSNIPAQTGAAVVNIQGNTRRFLGLDVQGLIFNTTGTVNMVGAKHAADSTFIGNPLNHADIPNRQNVQLLSNQRGLNGRVTRNGVKIVRNLSPIGPLSMPVVAPGS